MTISDTLCKNRPCYHCGKDITNDERYIELEDFVFFLCPTCLETLRSRLSVLCLEFLGEAPKDIEKHGAWIYNKDKYYQCSLCSSISDQAIERCKVCNAQMHL